MQTNILIFDWEEERNLPWVFVGILSYPSAAQKLWLYFSHILWQRQMLKIKPSSLLLIGVCLHCKHEDKTIVQVGQTHWLRNGKLARKVRDARKSVLLLWPPAGALIHQKPSYGSVTWCHRSTHWWWVLKNMTMHNVCMSVMGDQERAVKTPFIIFWCLFRYHGHRAEVQSSLVICLNNKVFF